MSILFSSRMNFADGATEVPLEIVEEIDKASQRVSDPDTANSLFEQVLPILESCRPNRTFALACGMLMEKRRNAEGMLAFWSDLSSVFPEDLTALRMMMRWYRRERMNAEGIDKVQKIYPIYHQDRNQASKAIVALSELKAFQEIDEMMSSILSLGKADRTLKMRYIKVLNQQLRFLDSHEIAQTISDAHKMGPTSQELLNKVARRSASVNALYSRNASDAFETIMSECPPSPVKNFHVLGNITFFTGQLGTGGAERQLTRLAAALQAKYETAEAIGGVALIDAPRVCVRHANAASGGDFFLPMLKKAHVQTNILTEMDAVRIENVPNISAKIATLLDVLPEDIAEQTCKLVPYFRNLHTRVAYLWQDGGVLSAALAALIAGVPRIITSFRGLPPNMRPNLMRPELEPFYKALALRPEVTFTANSRCAATAYEDWLDLKANTVKTIPNAIPEVLPDGEQADYAYWSEVTARSPSCDKTVVGVFRFDENKRPFLWVDAAIDFARRNPKVRFILVGSGYLFAQTRDRIRQAGMNNRIFLAGIRRNVGFYLHRCDLVMHLARMEGLPNVLIEAQLAGKAVLATPAGGTSEVICHGVTGRILPDANNPLISDIVEELDRLFAKPKRLASMGEAGLREAQPKYLVGNVLEKTIKLFATGETDI